MFDKETKGADFWEEEIPADLQDMYEEKRLEMMEAVAEQDEAMMEKYLEEGTLSEEDIHYCIRKATIAQDIVPVVCGTAFRNVGVQLLLDAIVTYLPSPLDIEEMKGTPGALMPVMQKAQEIYGYLPIEVQSIISDAMDVPIEKIYGVATFYAQFALAPKGENEVSVCLGTACYVKGSQAIYDKISEVLEIGEGECTPDRKFSLVSCRCVGACGLAPVMIVGEDVYGRMTPDQVEDVLNKYR